MCDRALEEVPLVGTLMPFDVKPRLGPRRKIIREIWRPSTPRKRFTLFHELECGHIVYYQQSPSQARLIKARLCKKCLVVKACGG